MKTIYSYIITLISLAVLDTIWLGFISKNFYKENLGHLFRSNPIWPAIIIFYFLYAAAIIYFAVLPAGGSWVKALFLGALLGAVAYMTYDLVNYATLKDWPLLIVMIDITWGIVITGIAALVASLIIKP